MTIIATVRGGELERGDEPPSANSLARASVKNSIDLDLLKQSGSR